MSGFDMRVTKLSAARTPATNTASTVTPVRGRRSWLVVYVPKSGKAEERSFATRQEAADFHATLRSRPPGRVELWEVWGERRGSLVLTTDLVRSSHPAARHRSAPAATRSVKTVQAEIERLRRRR